MNFNIKHDNKNNKFFSVIAGKECSLRYEKLSNNVLDAKLMFVPKNMRGQGIASRLVEHVISYAKRNEMKIKPTCSYLEEFFVQNPKHKNMLYNSNEVTVMSQE
ncbi:MAG: GNAT family N-acetyltransferase [Cytophagaceae bacterium]